MANERERPIYSGASPHQVAADLEPLVDFQAEGLSLEALSHLIGSRLVPHLMRYDRPGFLSMFNAVPEEGAHLGAGVALHFNQGVTNWQVSPGGAMLEELCCKRLCRLFGLPPSADATFMYCGTYANQQALYLALHRRAAQEGFDFGQRGLTGFRQPRRLTVLASEDAHFSLRHGVRLLGLGEQNLVALPVDGNRRIDIDRAQRTVRELAKTRDIFCLVATAGTTGFGSVDPIAPLADTCRQLGAWLHVDGAYGLAYSLVPGWKALFAGLERADSICWDPHKQLGVPIPNSLLFVTNGQDFKRMALYSHYFNRPQDEGTEPQPGLKSPPSTRPLAALPLVACLRHQGQKRLIEGLQAPLQAIRSLAEHLEGAADIRLAHTPDTGILCFRLQPAGTADNHLDDLQEYVYRKILDSGQRTIAITRLNDQPVLRLVAVSPTVTLNALLEAVSAIRSAAAGYKET